jgi:hypothetical protein
MVEFLLIIRNIIRPTWDKPIYEMPLANRTYPALDVLYRNGMLMCLSIRLRGHLILPLYAVRTPPFVYARLERPQMTLKKPSSSAKCTIFEYFFILA